MSSEDNDKAGEARRRLVAVRALGLFARLGFEKVSFRDISKATGVPRTAIYRYYHTKREIFDAAIGGVLSDMRKTINATLAERRPATARLSRVCGWLGRGVVWEGVLSPWGSGIRMPALEPPYHLLTMTFEAMPA